MVRNRLGNESGPSPTAKILERVCQLGGSQRQLAQLTNEESGGILDGVAQIILGRVPKNLTYFSSARLLEVDYDRGLPELVSSGCYGERVNRLVLAPSQWEVVERGSIIGKRSLWATFFHFALPVSSAAVAEQVKQYGYRLALAVELLALEAENPSFEGEKIVAMGSHYQDFGNWFVPIIDGERGKRRLDLQFLDSTWSPRTRFLVVKEIVKRPD